MTITLSPELQRFIDAQVKAGRYPSPDAVLTEALLRLMEEDAFELDQQTLDAIDESEDQIDRHDFRPWNQVCAELRARYLRS